MILSSIKAQLCNTEEAGRRFFSLRTPQIPKGAPPLSAQCPQPFAGFAFQEWDMMVDNDWVVILWHHIKCSGSLSCRARCAASPQEMERTEGCRELVPNICTCCMYPSSKERCPCGYRNLKNSECKALNCSEACDLISAQKPVRQKSWTEGQELVILHASQGWNHSTLGSHWPLSSSLQQPSANPS